MKHLTKENLFILFGAITFAFAWYVARRNLDILVAGSL